MQNEKSETAAEVAAPFLFAPPPLSPDSSRSSLSLTHSLTFWSHVEIKSACVDGGCWPALPVQCRLPTGWWRRVAPARSTREAANRLQGFPPLLRGWLVATRGLRAARPGSAVHGDYLRGTKSYLLFRSCNFMLYAVCYVGSRNHQTLLLGGIDMYMPLLHLRANRRAGQPTGPQLEPRPPLALAVESRTRYSTA